jgi:hypothetical protein
MPQREAWLVEPEGAAIGYVHLVFDVLLRGGEIAGVAGLARAVPSPLLDRLILRQRPGKDLLSDEGADVAALLLDYRALPTTRLEGRIYRLDRRVK